MNRLFLSLALALPLAAQQSFDFKSLTKLNAIAKDATNVTLEGPTLKLAASFLGSDADSAAIKSIIAGLTRIQVHTWEFDRDGMYTQADIEPFREFARSLQWPLVVDVKEDGETSQVFLKAGSDNKAGGVAVLSAEKRELTIVYIEGAISVDDIAKLSGTLDIPDLGALKRGTSNGGKSNANGKKEE